MISLEQIKTLSKKYLINESVVAREYFQLLFLNELYSKPFSSKIYFKGGTAIRLIYGGKRFSEDLDFTVLINDNDFEIQITEFFKSLTKIYPIEVKEKESLAGKSYLLSCSIENFEHPIFIKLDFSFREIVIENVKKIITSDYPIIMSNYIFTLSLNEIIAEKIRAIMTRNKPRDIYDLWILQELGGKINFEIINKKLAYYKQTFNYDLFISKINQINQKDFIIDLRPFIPTSEREELPKLYELIKDYCIQRLTPTA